MMKYAALTLSTIVFAVTACGTADPDASAGTGADETTEPVIDPNLNTDGDCMTDVEEIELGTDPELADTDGDTVDDCAEIACGSDPLDVTDECYACGWKKNDPGDLVSDGTTLGSVLADVGFVDQCGELVRLHDFWGEYHILYMTAAW